MVLLKGSISAQFEGDRRRQLAPHWPIWYRQDAHSADFFSFIARPNDMSRLRWLGLIATFRRKIDVFGFWKHGQWLRPSKDRRSAGGLF
jgi:hypothetical protein